MAGLPDRVSAWLDERTEVEVVPDLGGGWAAVLAWSLFRSAGLPAAAGLRIVLAGGGSWQVAGLDRVIGRPVSSGTGRLLAGWALREGEDGRTEAGLWVLSPRDRSRGVRWVDSVPVPWRDTGLFPVLVCWAGEETLVAGAPGGPACDVHAEGVSAQVFEDVPGSRVRVDADLEPLVALWRVRIDGRGGRRPAGLDAGRYRLIRVSPGGRYLAAFSRGGLADPPGTGTVSVAGLRASGHAAQHSVVRGLSRMGWLADGRLVGVLHSGDSGGSAVVLLWQDGDVREDREVVAADIHCPPLLGKDVTDPPWWFAAPDGRLVCLDRDGITSTWTAGEPGRPEAAAPARLVMSGSGTRPVITLLAVPGQQTQGDARLQVLHRVRVGPDQVWAGTGARTGDEMLTVERVPGHRGRDRIRVVDLGDPLGDRSMRVAVHLPARAVRGCVVRIEPSSSAGPPLPMNGSDPARLLVAAGYAVAEVRTAVPWWPQVPDENIRPGLAQRVTAAVTGTKLGEYADTTRLAVSGASFGATIALIALADTGLFATAMVFAGGYCRALTPLGFQDEHRAWWQAPVVYRDFDAVASAPRITRPVLIMHGLADQHPATPPEQAHLLYQALIGAGVPARLVLMPGEGHRLSTREGVSAWVTEQVTWLERQLG